MATRQAGAAEPRTVPLEPVGRRRPASSGVRQLAGRYELHERIGGGGMGAVYRGRDCLLDRTVAVKVLPPGLATDGAAVARFAREARSAAALSHPNIIAVFDAGIDGDTSFIVMEHVEGESLAALVGRDGRLPPARAAAIAAHLARALAAAHRRGIVHRDVKPGNVMIGASGQVKLLDFGIARAQQGAALTQAGWVLGSSGYLSPEVARGERAQEASDVYGLGCVLYELLTARAPFTGEAPAAVLQQHVSSTPRAPSTIAPGIPPALEALVLRTLAKRPADRPDAAQLAAALEGLAAPTRPARGPSRARPMPVGGRERGRARRSAVLGGLLAAAAIAAFALVAAGGLSPGQGTGPSATAHAADAHGVGRAWRLPLHGAAISQSLSRLAATALVELQPAPEPVEPAPAPPAQRPAHKPKDHPAHPKAVGHGHHGQQGRDESKAGGAEADGEAGPSEPSPPAGSGGGGGEVATPAPEPG